LTATLPINNSLLFPSPKIAFEIDLCFSFENASPVLILYPVFHCKNKASGIVLILNFFL
jgi:hypothetical protein